MKLTPHSRQELNRFNTETERGAELLDGWRMMGEDVEEEKCEEGNRQTGVKTERSADGQSTVCRKRKEMGETKEEG